MFKSYILQAILVSHIVAMAIPAVAVNAAIVRSVGDTDADEAIAYTPYPPSGWDKRDAAVDADEAIAYTPYPPSGWDKSDAEVDADEVVFYNHRIYKKEEADADEATVYPRPAW